MKRKKSFFLLFAVAFFLVTPEATCHPWTNGRVIVSSNGRFLQYENGTPFFWLGDTGWRLCEKLNRMETRAYLKDRSEKEFNVIQCMVIHSLPEVNAYHDTAFIENSLLKPRLTKGHDTVDQVQYDYWDHLEWAIDEAARNGLYLALIPIWGSAVKLGDLPDSAAESYATFLADRFKNKPNIFWIVGGDLQGNVKMGFWETLGRTLKKRDPLHLVTYHPYGRMQSSTWFHQSAWLDFNMFQSGHRRYDQDNTSRRFGEDNWRFVRDDYNKKPAKPTLDGEPSYENIPQGLHDTTQPRWNAPDVRRYAYWSVFAGACGHTYGNNSVMQMLHANDKKVSYGARKPWDESLQDSGSQQMKYVKRLMLSRPYFDRVYDSSLVLKNTGTRYDYILATRGSDYLMAYTYAGRKIEVKMGRISGVKVTAWWFDPRNGVASNIGTFKNKGIREFNPPGTQTNGNDWVLVVDNAEKGFGPPGIRANLK
ncbi:MAG: DUF4038 domain-containing protein [Ignavibacteriae bacterium]|nr:MAG: DUF4038 domain-containing protein [Ignavibacteriota bacterium]